MKKIFFIVVIGLLLQRMVLADDLFAPDWRGQGNTVMGLWDNWDNAPAGYYLPDEWNTNPHDPQMGFGDSSVLGTILSSYDTRTGVIELTDDYQLDFWLPNFPEMNPYKEIQVQLTYMAPANVFPVLDIDLSNSYSDPTIVPAVVGPELIGSVTDVDGWVTDAYLITVAPNPISEYIAINFTDYTSPAYVDQVVIDTVCVPEPATVLFFCLGGTALLKRRRSA